MPVYVWPTVPALSTDAIEAFLARPLVAHIATAGPTVRPVWYLWEDGAFWILTGPWSKLSARVQRAPAVAIVVDVCDLVTGETVQVIAKGEAELLSFDTARGFRKLSRYLGPDESNWDRRFRSYLRDDPETKGTRWLRVTPTLLTGNDFSFSAQGSHHRKT